MQHQHDPQAVFAQYRKGIGEKMAMNLYENVVRNQNFYIGRQWEGVHAPDLDKPVFNVMKRIINQFVSLLISDDVSAQLTPLWTQTGKADELAAKVVNTQLEKIIELSRFKTLCRDVLRTAAVDGDTYLYVYYEKDKKNAITRGDIHLEMVDNTHLYYGNPKSGNIQTQPYLIVAMREDVKELAAQMAQNGGHGEILPDSEQTEELNPMAVNDNCATVLLKFWKSKQTGTVFMTRVTQSAVIKPPTDTGLALYPIAGFTWEKIKNCCHGQSVVEGLIPNQIAINKLYAMYIKSVKDTAFPKIVYDMSRLPKWTNRVGEAIGVYGNADTAVARIISGADVSYQVPAIIDNMITMTKELMGASDTMLGNVLPENTSAIVAIQKASSLPLDLQKMSFYQFVEDTVQIFYDIMRTCYGLRTVTYEDGERDVTCDFDFASLSEHQATMKVDVGASTYFSEIVQIQTMDNLFAQGVIPDAKTYLDSLPDSYVKNKQKLLSAIMKKQEDEKKQKLLESLPEQPLTDEEKAL